MIVAGIDPGIHGGLAIVAVEDSVAPQLVEAIDVPVIGTNAKERVDAIAIREWVSNSSCIRTRTAVGIGLARGEGQAQPETPGLSDRPIQEMTLLYNMKLKQTTAVTPRVVDAHGLLHLRTSKAAKACDAADLVDGLAMLQNPTLRVAAAAYGLSVGYVARALRLTPEQRHAVRRGKRPLNLPSTPPVSPARSVPATLLVPPVVMGARERLKEIVAELGADGVLNMLAAMEKVAA